MVSPKELLSNIESSLLAPNTPSPTQRINLIHSIRRARSSLQSLLTFPPPKASDRAQVQSREVRLPDSGPISLDEQDVQIALKLSDDLHLNEIDCVQLLVSANQEWGFLGREPLDILRLTAGLWYTGRRDLLTALYSLLRAVVLDPGLDDDLVADIQKYLEDLLNSGLRQRLISLIKELNREEAAGLGGPNCEPYIIDSRGALVERRAVVCRERLLLGHCLILSVLVVRASSKDLKDLFSVLKDTTTELDGSNDILKYQSNDDVVGTVDGVAAGVTVPPSNAISRPRGRPRKTPRKLSGKALGRPKKIEKIEIEEKKKLEEEDVELTKRTYEKQCFHLENQAKETKDELESKIIELERRLADSWKKVEEHQALSQSKYKRWKRKELGYKSFLEFHSESLQELRTCSNSLKQESLKIQNFYMEEINHLGLKLKSLVEAAQNYHAVLEENRKLYNEVQDLKGNIRVYCRIRPFLSGQSRKQTTIEYMGENGDLVVKNPSKQGKASHRLFKFNKVFGPAASQEEVFLDTQQLIRSVLDGYNVCIFAYGQTGSGKTYTMTGPNLSSKVDWGVNYRALNDLFHLSQSRKSSITYEVSVQMVEIYNEQVRDLLTGNNQQKNLGIWNSTQPNGLAVPDASVHHVTSTSDVLELMSIGLMNRAVGATALNERSSRSHSVLSVHVQGMDLKTSTVLRGNLHLVDLAGSERVDRSEATGDRLREAQHINKSLSALGDVIFALAQKSPHVPYRNSKLTQVLQSSLGGQAKTLMFVQLNPDVESYSETISTLKFAERVSGVELGAAQSNKEGRGVRELMDQVAFLKDAVERKDQEISHLRTKANSNGEKNALTLSRYGSPSPRRHSIGTPRPSQRLDGKATNVIKKAASDMDKSSDYSDKHSEAGSPLSDDFRHQKEFFQHPALDATLTLTRDLDPSLPSVQKGHNSNDEFELLGFGEADSEERLSDISDGVLSMATETDVSVNSIVEYTLFPEASKSPTEIKDESTKPPSEILAEITKPPTEQSTESTEAPAEILAESTKPPAEKSSVSARLPRPAQKLSHGSSRMSSTRSSSKGLSSSTKAATSTSSIIKSNSTPALLKTSKRRL